MYALLASPGKAESGGDRKKSSEADFSLSCLCFSATGDYVLYPTITGDYIKHQGRTYGIHKNIYVSLFLVTLLGPTSKYLLWMAPRNRNVSAERSFPEAALEAHMLPSRQTISGFALHA